MEIRFRTTLLQNGKTATGFEVPAELVAALGAGKRPPVVVGVNGYTYRSTVAVMGGACMIGVSAEHRAGAKVSGGDQIEVTLTLDTQPREVVVPADFAAALASAPGAQRFFDALSYSNRSRVVFSIEGAKTAETRQRRIDKSVAALGEGRI